jgi:hypothetical protein
LEGDDELKVLEKVEFSPEILGTRNDLGSSPDQNRLTIGDIVSANDDI